MTNVDGDVDGKGYYTDDEEDDELRLENVVQEEDDELMEDIKQGIEIRFELDDGGDDYRRYAGALITNGVENVDENEEGREQIYERKQGAEARFSVDKEGDDDYRQEREALIRNMEDNLDEKERKDDVLRRGNLIEEEEREQMEDINQGIEMRLGLDVAARDEHKRTEEVSIANFSGVDEQGYEEDIGEYLEGDDVGLEEERKGEDPSVEMHPIDENSTNAQEVDGLDVVMKEIKGYNSEEEVTGDETEEMAKGSTGLFEKTRDEGKIDDAGGGESASNGVFKEGNDIETTEPVTVKEIDSQKLVVDGSKNEEPIGEMRRVVVLAGGNEENNFNSREVEELDLVAREVAGDTNKDTCEDAILRTKKERLIHSNADARKIGDESGLYLFDDRNTNMNFESLEGGNEVKENTTDDDVDILALPAFRRAPLDSDKAKVASKTDRKVPSREDILEDEKIWEKIGAMRAIVGYKAPSQPTCIGELKALYVFTGVEPPASFKGDSDLDEVNTKLKFLMSIVGVK